MAQCLSILLHYRLRLFAVSADAGKSAAIHYGTGAISGFFSQDNVRIGDLVVKNQVMMQSDSHLF